MEKYTFICEFQGGAYISQYITKSLSEANSFTYFPHTGTIYHVRGAAHPALIRNIKNYNNHPKRLFWGVLNAR